MMLIKTCVKPSAIHGLGLFALRFIPGGTPIWRFQSGFDHDFSPAQFTALPPPAREHTRWFCFVSKIDGHVILSGDHACFLNHSPSPNTGAPFQPMPPVETVALRDIAAGEELTCNYFDYDADTAWKLGLVPANAALGAGVPPADPDTPCDSRAREENPAGGVNCALADTAVMLDAAHYAFLDHAVPAER